MFSLLNYIKSYNDCELSKENNIFPTLCLVCQHACTKIAVVAADTARTIH